MKINSEEEIEDWPGVYAIINKTNGREYVGSSEKGILSRINQHERLLKTGKHNRKEMQEDYNNGDVFEAEIIFILPIGGTRKQLLSREIEEIKKRGAKTRLYNAPNWVMYRNPQTGKLEKIEYTGSYYLPRQYLGGAWDNGRGDVAAQGADSVGALCRGLRCGACQQCGRQCGGGGDLLCKFHVLCSFAFQVCPVGLPGLWGGAALFERCDPARASA